MADGARREIGRFVVAAVRSADSADGPAGSAAPAEIAERFEGRAFTLQELEYRGVRIAGGLAVYTANSRDWLLDLTPIRAS